MSRITLVAGSGALVLAAAILEARGTLGRVAPPNGSAVIHKRQQGMEAIGKATIILNRQVKASEPNMKEIRSAAATIARLARVSSKWFPAGSGSEAGKTKARPEIWQNPDDFLAKLDAFQKESARYATTTRGRDAGALKPGFRALGLTCKGCHELYREGGH